jgi:hypothetical protein
MVRRQPHGTIARTMTHRHPRFDRLAVLSIATALLLAACDTAQPSATPSATPAPSPSPTASTPPPSPAPTSTASNSEADAVYDAIQEQVVAMRGLEPTREVERATLSEADLGAEIERMYHEETPPELTAANERLYKALGLMPADQSLEELTIEMLSGGVAGYYRDDQNKLYIVSKTGDVGVNEKITFAHEFDHALQDQHFPVFKDQDKVIDRSDWILARQAVYEGDATLLMTLWASENFTPAEFQELLRLGTEDESVEMLERMPVIMRETLLWPYQQGAVFAQTAYMQGGWDAINAFYDDMPESTEQILHADKLAQREPPKDVQLPDTLAADIGTGWSVGMEDTFGEFQMGIWLRETNAPTPSDAAAGWGGDRVAVLNGPNDTWAVVLATDWDSAADAAQFENAATVAVETLDGSTAVLPGAGGTVRWVLVASDDETLETVSGALGLAG